MKHFSFKVPIPKGRVKADWCGPAALWNVAYEFGINVSQAKLVKVMGTTHVLGTDHNGMLKGCRFLKLTARWVKLDDEKDPFSLLDGQLKKGNKVILDWMTGEDEINDGHYSEYLGRTLQGGVEAIVVGDPEWIGSIRIMGEDEFKKVWYDTQDDGKGKIIERFVKYALIINKPS